MNDYLLHVKSTLDKKMTDMVTALTPEFPNLQGVDVDNLTETEEVMKSENPVILWQFLTLSPAPKDPLYRLNFLVGAKTTSDKGSYTIARLSNDIGKEFEVNSRIEVGDYSGAVEIEGTGYFLITDNSLAPQQYDHMSGIRFFSVVAMGSRNF